MKISNTVQPKLTRAVIKQLKGAESLRDIANHGIDGGFCGFVYYADTVAFYRKNRTLINERIDMSADDQGIDPLSFVAGFNCLVPADGATKRAIMICLGGGRLNTDNDAIDMVCNALSWFAAEEIAQEMNNE
jgi:hypothetical protein